MTTKTHEVTRREFIRQASCAALELTGVVNTMGFLRLTNAAVIQGNLYQVNDYKALVCIFLAGGNDSNNMLVPAGTAGGSPPRADYEGSRTNVALPVNQLHPLNLPNNTRAFNRDYGGGTYPMGIHPSAKPIADLFNAGELGIVCNVGSLLYPIGTREDYVQKLVETPPRLFAHNTQQMQWQTSIPDQVGAVGWGGRLADLLDAGYNGDASKASMSISLAGINTFQRGLTPETAAFALSSNGVRSLSGFGGNYSQAIQTGSTFENPIYRDNRQGARLQMVEQLMKLTNQNLLEDEYAQSLVSARTVEGVVGNALSDADASNVDFDGIFANAQSSLGDQLKMIARLITGRSSLGNRRQIFFARVGGYDNHNNLIESHAPLMEELGNSLQAFRNALVAAGEWENTVAFTASDFARTLSPNSDGTDHAWGGHAIVMGGPVNGGDLYGHFPPLKTGDVAGSMDSQTRGRIIPTTSVDQYSAPLAQWFGADSNSMETIFPNLVRFDDPFTSSTANLQFI
ncbi:MAG: DUF1501 domain-containing protein [Chloroflexota bacterium]